MGSPALLSGQAGSVLERINALIGLARTNVSGGAIADGGTTQASGANAAFNLDLDTAIAEGKVDNVPLYKAAGTDIDATAGAAVLWGATSGKDVTAAVVIHTGSAGLTAAAFEVVVGTVADTGESVAPTEDEIDTALGHTHWVLLGDVVFSRTADTTVTVTPSYARRASLGYKVTPAGSGPSYTGDLSETEAEYRGA